MQQEKNRIMYAGLTLKKGRTTHMEWNEHKQLTGCGGGSFYYLAGVFDTENEDETYHRFQLEGKFSDCKYEVVAATVNQDISEQMYAPGITAAEQYDILLECTSHVRCANTRDFLLHDLRGRYLWIMVRITAAKLDSHFVLEYFSVEYPCDSFISYLPEIYQTKNNDFFNRYMAVLQSLYEDLEHQVELLPQYLDYEEAAGEHLEAFAGWIGIRGKEFGLSDEQKRELIRQAGNLQTSKGTAKMLRELLWFLTGVPVYILEHFKWIDYMKEEGELNWNYKRLYGERENVFTVFVDYSRQDKKQPRRDMEWLEKKILSAAPMGMECNLIYLEETSHMDLYCYLDVNSRLSTPAEADTSGILLGGNYLMK